MTETAPTTPPTTSSPTRSIFGKLRVIILILVLVVLLGVLYFLWQILQSQQRADYVISGEDLFNTGIIDRIIKRGPSQPAPEPTDPPLGDEAKQVQQRANKPSELAKGEQTYFIRTSGQGPQLTKLVISEFDPEVGSQQALQVEAKHSSPITSLTATLKTDTKTETYELQLNSGSNTEGMWTVTYPVTDTHDLNYSLTLEAVSPSQPVSQVDLTFR